MPEKFECPKCGNSLIVLKLDSGKEAECARCGLWNTIPDSTFQTSDPLNCRVRTQKSELDTPVQVMKHDTPEVTTESTETARVASDGTASSPDAAPDETAARAAAFREALLKSTPRAVLTRVLLGCNVLVFILITALGASFLEPGIAYLVRFGARYNTAIFHANEWWRLVTACFLSAGIGHLTISMWFLWIFGNLAERVFGNAQLLVIYLASGIIGTLVGFIANPAAVSATASACVLGIAGSLIAFIVTGRVLVPRILVNKIIQDLVIFGAISLAAGLFMRGADNTANLGGLATGFIAGLVLTRRLNVPDTRKRSATLALLMTGVLIFTGAGVLVGKAFIEKDPANEIAHIEVLLSQGKESEALDILDSNHDLFSRMNNGEYYRALLHMKKNEFGEGITILRTLIATAPDNPLFLFTLAHAYLDSGAHAESKETFRDLIRIAPDNAVVYGNLAWAYYRTNDFHTCIALSKHALGLDASLTYARYNIALATLRLGDVKSAVTLYSEIKPGKKEREDGTFDGAIEDLEELVQKGIMREESREILRTVFSASDDKRDDTIDVRAELFDGTEIMEQSCNANCARNSEVADSNDCVTILAYNAASVQTRSRPDSFAR